MNVNGINANGAGMQSFQMKMNQGTDAVSKNLQNQIMNAQKQIQELGENKEMSLEDKMKKRQEIQQQISDLQTQLRQHQFEQRMKEQQKNSSSMNDMLGGSKQAAKKSKGGSGMSSASMQAIISADSSMNQARVQGAVKSQMEGKAGVLEAEIKIDSARGADVSKKKEELAEVEEKANNIADSQINTLADANKKLQEAAKADQEAAKTEGKDKTDKKDKAKDKDKADKTDKESKEVTANESVEDTVKDYIPIDIISEGITTNIEKNELAGNSVDLKI